MANAETIPEALSKTWMRKLLVVCWTTCQMMCVSLVERVGVSHKDLDLSRVPSYSLVLSDPIVNWILQKPENDAPKSREDHCQQATGASARPVMVLGESCFGNHAGNGYAGPSMFV